MFEQSSWLLVLVAFVFGFLVWIVTKLSNEAMSDNNYTAENGNQNRNLTKFERRLEFPELRQN